MDKHIIGQRIRLLRERKDLTQDALAELVRRYVPKDKSVPRNMFSYYENGHSYPDFYMIRAIARALETSIEFLVGETDNPEPANKPVLSPAPELWDMVRHANKQPPYVRRLLAQLYDALMAYARGVTEISSFPPETSEGDRRAAELAAWVETPADALLGDSLAESAHHEATAIDEMRRGLAAKQESEVENTHNEEGR